jgi:hypothetical protein
MYLNMNISLSLILPSVESADYKCTLYTCLFLHSLFFKKRKCARNVEAM